ncbi:MAG: hemolysin family protein [Alphaproteobacteria bacterium]
MNDTSSTSSGRAGDGPHPSLFETLRHWLRGLFGAKAGEESLRAAIEEMIVEGAGEETTIAPGEKTLLTNILNLKDVTVEDVMVPRADIVAVDIETPFDDLVALLTAQAHSRVPVYRETLDDVAGMVHIKDVMAWIGNKAAFKLAKLLRKVLFVAPSMRVLDLLLEMRMTRVHMALVVDEYGGIDGLVTVEDLVEEIVGEIEDEHEIREVPVMIERPDGSIEASARATLEEFETRFGGVATDEEREDIDTLGGLVFSIAGRVPTRGEVIRHTSGLEFEVLDADPRRIRRLIIRKLPGTAGEGEKM